jgi:hypothetical protein
MGLPDRYDEIYDLFAYDRIGVPRPGYEGNIMADRYGAPWGSDIVSIILQNCPAALLR